jgi:MGT family glycosyltransferase
LYGFGIFSYNKAYSINKDIKKYGGNIQWWEYGTLRLKVPGIVLCPIEFDFPVVTETSDRCYGGTGIDVKRLNVPFNWAVVDKAKPLIYCSIGSHPLYCKDRIKLYLAVIESLKDRPHLQGIIQVWNKQERNSLNPEAGNVIIMESVPQIDVLSRAHIFITHGGLSSVRESIYCGVPMIVFPWGVEQPGNSARIIYHHLGLRGDIQKVTGKTLGDLIDKIFSDPSYNRSVKQMQKIFLEKENFEKGISFIDTVIAASTKKTTREQNAQPHAAAEKMITIEI